MSISRKDFKNDLIYDQILKKSKKKDKLKNLFKKELTKEEIANMKSLDIDNFGVINNLNFLSFFKELKEIDFENVEIRDLENLVNLENLKSLWFEDICFKTELPILNIESLMIENCIGFSLNYDFLRESKNLKSLYLVGIDEEINLDKLLNVCPNLKTLYINETSFDKNTLNSLLYFNDLEKLSISYLNKENIELIKELSKKGIEIELYDYDEFIMKEFEHDENVYM